MRSAEGHRTRLSSVYDSLDYQGFSSPNPTLAGSTATCEAPPKPFALEFTAIGFVTRDQSSEDNRVPMD